MLEVWCLLSIGVLRNIDARWGRLQVEVTSMRRQRSASHHCYATTALYPDNYFIFSHAHYMVDDDVSHTMEDSHTMQCFESTQLCSSLMIWILHANVQSSSSFFLEIFSLLNIIANIYFIQWIILPCIKFLSNAANWFTRTPGKTNNEMLTVIKICQGVTRIKFP